MGSTIVTLLRAQVRRLPAWCCTALIISAAQAAPVPAGAPLIPAAHFVEDDAYTNPVLSPDGSHLAVLTTLPDWIGSVKTLAIIRVKDFKIVTAVKMERFEVPLDHVWVSNTRLVVAKARDFGDDEKPTPTGEILTLNLDGSGQDYLYGRLRGTAADAGFGVVSGLPAQLNGHFYMTEYEYGRKNSALYDVDSVANTRAPLLQLPFAGVEMLFDHQSRPRFASAYTRDAKVAFLQFDAAKSTWVQQQQEAEGNYFAPLAFSADDSAVYATLSQAGKPAALVRQDLATGERTVVAEDPAFDITLVKAGRNTREPFGWMPAGGSPRLHYLDPASKLAQLHQRLSGNFPGSYVRLLNTSETNDRLLFYVSSGRDPGAYYIYDSAANRADLVSTSLPRLDPDQLGERKPISFKARDGVALHGFLTLPAAPPPGPLPLVLLPHGGPHGIADDWRFDPYAHFLASRGYAVLQVNYRGSGGRGAAFVKAGYEQWGGRIQDDLADGVRWAVKEGIADQRRMCVFGMSFGAYSAMMLAAREPGMFRCAAGYAGVYDLEMLLRDEDKKDRIVADGVIRKYLGKDPAQHRLNSPVNLAGNIKLPVLLIHGTSDEITPVAQGRAMRAALTAAGNPPEYLQVRNEGHGFFLPENKLKVLLKLEEFLKRNLEAAP